MKKRNQPESSARRAFLTTGPVAVAALATGCRTAAGGARRPSAPLAPWVDVRAHGAIGDGRTDDGASLLAALSAGAGTKVVIPPGTYSFRVSLEIPERTQLELLPGATLSCRLDHGGPAITLGNSARINGSGGTGVIIAENGCRISSLITNAKHDGTQEYAFVDGLSINAMGGANVTSALVELVALFVNSGIRDCAIAGAHAAPTGIRIAGGATTGFGPIYVDNVWVTSCAGHNIVVTENQPHRGSATCWFTNVTSEHQASGFNALHLQGYGGIYNVHVRNFHYENGNVATQPTAGIFVDGIPGFSLDGGAFLSAPITHKAGIVITDNELNYGCRIRGIQNINGINPILDDRRYRRTLGPRNIGFYETADPGSKTGHVDQEFVHLVRMPGGLSTLAKSGAVNDEDFGGATVPDGTLAVDTKNGRLMVRVAGLWKSVLLS